MEDDGVRTESILKAEYLGVGQLTFSLYEDCSAEIVAAFRECFLCLLPALDVFIY
jgi:hypothetical protein